MKIDVMVASVGHLKYVKVINDTIDEAAKARGTGIARRTDEYIADKINQGKAIIALNREEFVGFCYIEAWGHEKFVANSGLIVKPSYRGMGVAKRIKKAAFDLSRKKFPHAKLFGLTTGEQVMRINTELGYVPVTFAKLTDDEQFWAGCKSCVNYDILLRTNMTKCLCTGMVYDPELSLEVYTALANTGGFTEAELKTVEKKAYALGAKEHVNLDVTEDYYEKCIRYMVFGNVLRNKTYPVSVSSERTFQALAIVNYAKKVGAQYIAHGSTGAGNDQVRFDLCFAVFAPEMKVITPTRDLRLS